MDTSVRSGVTVNVSVDQRNQDLIDNPGKYIHTPNTTVDEVAVPTAGYDPVNDTWEFAAGEIGDTKYYDWGGGAYRHGDDIKVFNAAGTGALNVPPQHHEDGNYGWDIAGTDFIAQGGSLDYNAGDVKLERVAWDGSFDPDAPPRVMPFTKQMTS